MSDNKNYEITVNLPSGGLLYDDIPAQITLRAMTTADEKFLFGSTSSNAFSKVLQSCIVEPKNIDVSKLLPFDEQFLIIKLRTHTYGSLYHIAGVCPECGERHEFEVNLDEMPVIELDHDFKEPIECTLPECGDKLQLRLLRNKDFIAVRNQAKKLAKRMGVNARELEYVIRMSRYIVTINGEQTNDGAAQQYVEHLSGRDSAYFWWLLNDSVECGLDTTEEVTCPSCGEDYDLEFQINSEFFRPKFKR